MELKDLRALADIPIWMMLAYFVQRAIPVWLRERERDRQWRTQESESLHTTLRHLSDTITRHDTEDLARSAELRSLLSAQNERIGELLRKLAQED